MENTNLCKVTDISGFTPGIGRLVSMMNYVRQTTLWAVQGLTIEQLDYLADENGNTIGSLLFHIGAVELGFQIEIFDERKPNEQEIAEWGAAYDLGDKGRKEIKGNSLDFYIEKITAVRNRTLHELSDRNDEWLAIEHTWSNRPSNHHFIWFHVFEDEINHRGQIRILRKILPL